MIRLLVTLNAPQPDHCGFCPMLAKPTWTCLLFGEKLRPRESWGFWRAEECLAAERAAAKLPTELKRAEFAELADKVGPPEVTMLAGSLAAAKRQALE